MKPVQAVGLYWLPSFSPSPGGPGKNGASGVDFGYENKKTPKPLSLYAGNMKDVQVNVSALINAPVSRVWKYLTDPQLIEQWMGDPEMNIKIRTSWKVASPIRISGFHHMPFENTGTILQFDPESIIRYTHRSSISDLPDTPESYSVITYRLSLRESGTALNVIIDNFPTETIYKHLGFYWRATLPLLKRTIEQAPSSL